MDAFFAELERLKPKEKPIYPVIDDDSIEDDESDLEFQEEEELNTDQKWLISLCESLNSEFGSQVLYTMITGLLESDNGPEELQSLLVDILGFDHLESIEQILLKRDSLKAASTFVGLSKSARELQIRENERQALVLNSNLLPALVNKRYPHVYRKHDAGYTISLFGTKYALPEGSERVKENTYEQITIPYSKPDNSLPPEKLLSVSELDELCQITFSRYKTLNKIQSLVYPVGYKTSENMLICAPTGAGKTDVALIAMLNTIAQHCVFDAGDFDVDYENFKIIYITPMKALASEIVEKMGTRLAWLRIKVRELTGDMQLTRAEINQTQIIVTTPEKWDVVTRKADDGNGLTSKVKLIVIDEVHLLHHDRGSVIESIVARTQRYVEMSQSMIRLVGLSATLPNFVDVAEFLKVNPQKGLFYFDNLFRPCPLKQVFIGCKGKAGSREAMANIDRIAYEKVVNQVLEGNQVMVFVHAQKDTVKTAISFRKFAEENNELSFFTTDRSAAFDREVGQVKNSDMRELYTYGFGMHHAGMARSERNLTEKLFKAGAIRVLCCTATLAWGVNLPAAVVLIKGTQIYDSKEGGYVDLGIPDVIQIFGRAGRPQYEKFGTGILCTSRDKLDHYLSAITQQSPIESKFLNNLADNLNAEIAMGTISNVDEAVKWLGYTYLFVRMTRAPQKYGLTRDDVENDPNLFNHRRKLIISAARRLQKVQMINFDDGNTDSLVPKEMGRIASDFYLMNTSIEVFNDTITPQTSEYVLFSTISKSGEFSGIKYRPEEKAELEGLQKSALVEIKDSIESPAGKTNALLQAYISRSVVKDSALGSDLYYISQNAMRIARAFFLLCLSRRWGRLTQMMLDFDKAVSLRLWPESHPLLQFDLPAPIMRHIQAKNPSMENLKLMSIKELGELIHNNGMGKQLSDIVRFFPMIHVLSSSVQPLTSRVVRIKLRLEANFSWNHRVHGAAEYFWVWLFDDSAEAEMLHSEKLILSLKTYRQTHELSFIVPVKENASNKMYLKIISDKWLGSESVVPLSVDHLLMPELSLVKTPILNLRPLPVEALHNKKIEDFYRKRFSFFNPMQTMCFHSLYHGKSSVLLGSPTGSGKTIASELAIWAALRDRPQGKIVYIAPMKALIKERVNDWREGICKAASLKLVELTGDTNPQSEDIYKANLIVTTPEKFDGISRSWQTRKFVKKVSLIIMDEIHLLASDRGSTLEMIVSRMNFVQANTGQSVRFLGLSTAAANAGDMANWLGVKDNMGLFNFPPSVRPVPLDMYIEGFFDNMGFCPLMKMMNKPVYMTIKRHSPTKPALVFVPSRRQTRLTAQDLIHMCGNDDRPHCFLKMEELELNSVLSKVSDETLKLSLQFGIGIHHAGLDQKDRDLSYNLFVENKIQVLVATSTLAWGVNLPAYLVVIKGTQYFDAKISKYRDMDITDVLQMMGRAGRPAYDTNGVAVVLTRNSTKDFYKYFLDLGFPVESSLHKYLENHIGAEISSNTVKTRQNILDFLRWTFMYRRLHNNPKYYGVEEDVNNWLVDRVDKCIEELEKSGCLTAGYELTATPYLRIASFYYLDHYTIRMFLARLKPDLDVKGILQCLALASEFNELSVRHAEDLLNEELSKDTRYPGSSLGLYMGDPHVKAFLLLQARLQRLDLPIQDYVQDTIALLDQTIRVMQAMIDVMAEKGYLKALFLAVQVLRCIKQGCEPQDNMLKVLPGCRNSKSTKTIDSLVHGNLSEKQAGSIVDRNKIDAFVNAVRNLPRVTVNKASVTFNPKGLVYCPNFHKPQTESWILVWEIDGKIQRLQRNQRRQTISIPDEGTLHVLNDTIDVNYHLQKS